MTLTDRYIAETVRSLPPDLQGDVSAELGASIADATQALVDAGAQPQDAERGVLTGLGDPAALAARYADRPLHLIGPRFYLTWWRLLKVLLIIVPICVAGAVAFGRSLAGDAIGAIIGSSIGAGIGAVVQVGFWVTVVFVILERTGSDPVLAPWSVDRLPQRPAGSTSWSECVLSIGFLSLAAGALLWDHFRGFVLIDGVRYSFLDSGLWPWAIAGLLAVIVAEGIFAVAQYLTGGWDTALAVVNTVLAVLFVGWVLVFLIRGDLVNVDLLRSVFVNNDVDPDVLHTLAVLLGFTVTGISAWDIVDGWRKALRAQRAPRMGAGS